MKKLIEALSVSSEELTDSKKERLVKTAKRASNRHIDTLKNALDELDDKQEVLFESVTKKSFNPEHFTLEVAEILAERKILDAKLKIARQVHRELF